MSKEEKERERDMEKASFEYNEYAVGRARLRVTATLER